MTSAGASTAIAESPVARARTLSLARFALPPAVAIVILAAALLLLMTPQWMHRALTNAGCVDFYASVSQDCYQLSDSTVRELFLGPGTFSSFPVNEASHMRDVRVVLWGFLGLASVSLALVAWQLLRRGGSPSVWRSIARGGLLTVGFVLVVGAFAALAFGPVFELFHRIFFPGGNWAFSADSLLIRLYPYEFWQLTAGALGIIAAVAGVTVWLIARRRAKALEQG